VINRYVAEIEDTIALYGKFEGFTAGKDNLEITSGKAAGKCHVTYVVHDSKGTHEVAR